MADIHLVVLAAGKGTRMRSALPKVLHRVGGLPMIEHVIRTAEALGPASTTIVVGHGANLVEQALGRRGNLRFVRQEPQLGTAHALLTAAPALAGSRGDLLLLSGDVPLLTTSTLRRLLDRHAESGAAATVLTAIVENPGGYGRIVRADGEMRRIVEERDASDEERTIREINSGIYAFALDGLFEALGTIAAENSQREYYLPDLFAIYRRAGRPIDAVALERVGETAGINSRLELSDVNRMLRRAKNEAVMASGVTLEDPATTYIDPDVTIGVDTIIRPGVSLEGRTTIGTGCEIHSGVRITDSRLGDRVVVFDHCVIVNASIEDDARVGPFAHLREHAAVDSGAKVGNFVEMKKTRLGRGSKAMHLAYLGDAEIGAGVNIGAGTITCNYDGVSKQKTTIEDEAFVGSDSQLVAPVTVGRGAYVGTGTTVRADVPPGALAVSAGKQRIIEGWVEEKKVRRKEEKEEKEGRRKKEEGRST